MRKLPRVYRREPTSEPPRFGRRERQDQESDSARARLATRAGALPARRNRRLAHVAGGREGRYGNAVAFTHSWRSAGHRRLPDEDRARSDPDGATRRTPP